MPLEPVAVDAYASAHYTVEWYTDPPQPDAWFIVTRGAFANGEYPESTRKVFEWTEAEPAQYGAIQRTLSVADKNKIKDTEDEQP